MSLVGFLPGFIIGIISSILLLRLWNTPTSVYITQERVVASLSGSNILHVDDDKDGCSEIHLQTKPAPEGRRYLLLILIHSRPGAVELRSAIRKTWLQQQQHNHKQEKFVAKFVVGIADLESRDLRALACENKDNNGDLLLLPGVAEPVKKTEYSSSEKLIQSFIWAEENVEFLYLFKCMDSTFAILEKMVSDLEKRAVDEDYLWGFFAGGIEASRDTSNRLGEENWYLCTHYIPYPQGGGYVISHRLISILKEVSGHLEHYIHDDIALGVWLSPFNAIHRRHDVAFNTGYYSRGCHNNYIVTHKETPQSMIEKFNMVTEKGILCAKEYTGRPSYHYNWTAPAARCCIRESGVP